MSVTLHGPSYNPALPQVTPEAIADAVNAALASYGLSASGTFTNPKFGTNTAATSVYYNGPNASTRIQEWQNAGVKKWRWQVDGSATGANAGDDMRLYGFDDAGVSLGEVMRFIRSTGSITYNLGLNYTNPVINAHGGSFQYDKSIITTGTVNLSSGVAMGGGGANPMINWIWRTYTGTLDTGMGAPDFSIWSITDKVNAARALPATYGWVYSHNFEAPASGDRGQISLLFQKSAPAADHMYTGTFNLMCFMHADAGEATIGQTPLSRASCINFDCRIGGTGYAWETQVVGEIDIRTFTGNTVNMKSIWGWHWGEDDAVHGTVHDSGMTFTRATGLAPGVGGCSGTLIGIGKAGANLPWDPNTTATSSIMDVCINHYGNIPFLWKPQVGFGFELWGLDFQTNLLRSRGITIDGGGQITVLGPGAITHGASGIRIAVPNVKVTGGTIVSGGTHYRVNDYFNDVPTGSLWLVNSVDAVGTGVATSITLVKAGYAVSISNPVATKFGNGTGMTLNLTIEATGTLTLGDTGQLVEVAIDPTTQRGVASKQYVDTVLAGASVSLPTTPGASGTWWNNGGFVCIVP